MNEHRKEFLQAMFIPALFCLLFAAFFLTEWVWDIDIRTLGIYPRSVAGLRGVIMHVFVHGDISHLLNNMLSFFTLATALFYFHRKIATNILLFIWLGAGCLLWIIGRESWHIGASGLIYGIAFFLFAIGIFSRQIPLIAISLAVVFYYGSMVWYIFPWQENDTFSWEGHLAGAITGVALAFIYKKRVRKPPKIWLEDESEDDKLFAEYAESFELEGEKKIESAEE